MKSVRCWTGVLVSCLAGTITTGQQIRPSASPALLETGQIVQQLVLHNASRAEKLRQYEGCRYYSLEYTGFPHKSAEMVVEVNFRAPTEKQFRVVRQEGWHVLLNHVLSELLVNEKEAQKDPNQTALTPENYSFHLVGTGDIAGRPQYILEVTPRTQSKFLYRGKIWVDAADFAVTRISGEPAKNPSLWISHTAIEHEYKKVDEFWLPARNTSTTKVRLGGTAKLNIEYLRYEIGTPRGTPEVNICSNIPRKTQVSQTR